MSDDQTTPVEEFIPEGSVPIETVFRAPDFEVDVPDIETFRDVREDKEGDDDEAATEPAVEQPAQPAPVTSPEPVQTAESE